MVLTLCGLFIHIWKNFDTVKASLAPDSNVIFTIVIAFDFNTD